MISEASVHACISIVFSCIPGVVAARAPSRRGAPTTTRCLSCAAMNDACAALNVAQSLGNALHLLLQLANAGALLLRLTGWWCTPAHSGTCTAAKRKQQVRQERSSHERSNDGPRAALHDGQHHRGRLRTMCTACGAMSGAVAHVHNSPRTMLATACENRCVVAGSRASHRSKRGSRCAGLAEASRGRRTWRARSAVGRASAVHSTTSRTVSPVMNGGQPLQCRSCTTPRRL